MPQATQVVPDNHYPAPVLIVDDNPSKTMALQSIVETLVPQDQILIAHSGREACEHVLNQEFAVILLDVKMPEMDGFETAELILSRRRSSNTPILFVTADSQVGEQALHAYSLGAVDFITSPLISEVICAKVSVFLRLFRMRREIEGSKEALEISNTRIRQLSDGADIALVYLNVDGVTLEWNQNAEKLTGIEREQVINRHWHYAARHKQTRALFSPLIKRGLTPGCEKFSVEREMLMITGREALLRISISPLEDDLGVVITIADITAERKLQEDLADSKTKAMLGEKAKIMAKQLANLIDTAHAPIFSLDSEMRIVEWNPKLERITGLSCSTIKGRDLAEVLTPESLTAFDTCRKTLDESDGLILGTNCPLKFRSPNEGEVAISVARQIDDNNQLIGYVCVGQDLTDLRETQAQLIQASKMASLGEMSTGVAHELNQPLNVIRMAAANCLRKIKRDDVVPEHLIEKLNRISDQTARAAQIIDHMRMFGRKERSTAGPISPGQACRDALDMMSEQLRLGNIVVITELNDTEGINVLGHKIQLEQVIVNLLSNARDAINNNGKARRIEMITKQSEDRVSISVSDTGGGVPSGIRDRIFEPFFTTKAVGKGTGLGLSVSYGIIRDMGGELSVSDVHDGASFCITFPCTTLGSDSTPEPETLPRKTAPS